MSVTKQEGRFFETGKLYRVKDTTMWSFSKEVAISNEPFNKGVHFDSVSAYKGDILLVTEHVGCNKTGWKGLHDHHYKGLLLTEKRVLREEEEAEKSEETSAVKVLFVYTEFRTGNPNDKGDDMKYWEARLEKIMLEGC